MLPPRELLSVYFSFSCTASFKFCTFSVHRYTLTFNWLSISIQYFVHKIQSREHEHMHNLISDNDSLHNIGFGKKKIGWMSAIKKRHFLIAHAATFSLCIVAQWLFSIIIYDIQIQIQNIHNSAKSVNKVKMAVINSYKRFQFLLKCRNLKFMYVSKLRYIFCKKWWNRGKKSQQRQEVEGTMNCHTLSISYKRGIRKSWKRQKGTNSKKERSERNETRIEQQQQQQRTTVRPKRASWMNNA